MNEYDNEYSIVYAIYRRYLLCHERATEEQSRLADILFKHLHELRKNCELYKNDPLARPENCIKEIVKR